jgi:hypothetical protein
MANAYSMFITCEGLQQLDVYNGHRMQVLLSSFYRHTEAK